MNLQHTHTHTRLTALFPGLQAVSGSGIIWAICKSASRSRQITMPALYHSSFLQARCPSCRPTNSVKALKATNLQIEANSHIDKIMRESRGAKWINNVSLHLHHKMNTINTQTKKPTDRVGIR